MQLQCFLKGTDGREHLKDTIVLKVVMGQGQNFLTQVGSGQFFVARVGLGQPSMVWVWKISPKKSNFSIFFHWIK